MSEITLGDIDEAVGFSTPAMERLFKALDDNEIPCVNQETAPPYSYYYYYGLVIGAKAQQSAMERDETQGRQNGLDDV